MDTPAPAPQIMEGINGRAYLIQRELTLKQRNASRRELEAAGWKISSYGSNRNGWTITGWKGEAPWIIRDSFDLRNGGRTTTPLYRGSNGSETIDGTPERDA